MLKKLFAAALLLAFTATANATPLIGINGEFDIAAGGHLTLNADGSVSEIEFVKLDVSFFISETITSGLDNDFHGRLTTDENMDIAANPLILDGFVANSLLWSVAGFDFFISDVISNQTIDNTTGITIIGTLKHEDFLDTESQYFISGQGLNVGENTGRGFSATVTSPAPPVVGPNPPVEVSAPGTLAVFGLALIGFAASRRQKKSI